MHELSVCQNLVMQVERIAREQNARVSSITIKIGPLSGVEAALVEQAYPLAVAGTCLSAARLIIDSLPVRVHCRICKQDTDRSPEPHAVRTLRRLAYRIVERRRTTAFECGIEP